MESLFIGVAALACPVGMGVMMWLMMRGQQRGDGSQDRSAAREGPEAQVRQLRAEVEQLKADRAASQRSGHRADVP